MDICIKPLMYIYVRLFQGINPITGEGGPNRPPPGSFSVLYEKPLEVRS